MNVRVPLWGVVLTGFTMLFAVAFQQLGAAGAIEFFWFLGSLILCWSFSLCAGTLLAIAIVVNLFVFADGFERVRQERYEWYFINKLGLSVICTMIGFAVGYLSVLTGSWSPVSIATFNIASTWEIFWKFYLVAIAVSFFFRTLRGDWKPDW